jgi:hypothetical protein
MRNNLSPCIAVLAAFLCLTIFACGSEAQTIRATGYVANDSYQLNRTKFSDYPLSQSGAGVDRGCGDLTFEAEFSLPGSINQHTFTAALKRDGVVVQTGTTTFGPFFIAQNVQVTFGTLSFTPGTWTIEWVFQVSGNPTGSVSIVLLPPIAALTLGDQLYQFCNRNASITATSYSNHICNFTATPPTGFIYANHYYRDASVTTQCALGTYDGAHCLVMIKPATGFISANSFYKKYDACSRGTNDLAHCLLGPAPSGIFASNGSYYYPASTGQNKCPLLPGSTFDSVHCLIAPTAVSFILNGNFYINHDACSTGTNDGTNCHLGSAPWGTKAFEYQGNFYITPNMSCASGSYDGAHCDIGTPPVGATAFAQGGSWHWTPRYCP